LSEVWLLNFFRLTILVDPTAWFSQSEIPIPWLCPPLAGPLAKSQHMESARIWRLNMCSNSFRTSSCGSCGPLQISGVEMGDIHFYIVLWSFMVHFPIMIYTMQTYRQSISKHTTSVI
jgi:hypothetical protein